MLASHVGDAGSNPVRGTAGGPGRFDAVISGNEKEAECGEDVVGISRRSSRSSGCSVVWLTRLVWDQEIAGSNPVIPTTAKAVFMPWSVGTASQR